MAYRASGAKSGSRTQASQRLRDRGRSPSTEFYEPCGRTRRLLSSRCRVTARTAVLCSNSSSGIVAGRSAIRARKISASAGTIRSRAFHIAQRMPVWRIGRAPANGLAPRLHIRKPSAAYVAAPHSLGDAEVIRCETYDEGPNWVAGHLCTDHWFGSGRERSSRSAPRGEESR